MMLYKNTKVKVCFPDGDTDYFDIVAGLLHGVMDYANDMTFLANTPAQAKTLLHSLEQAAGGIGLHVNPDKTEYKCFNQRGDISKISTRD